MSAAPTNDPALRQGLASDLRTLARLHACEPERALLDELRTAPMQAWLALVLRADDACAALTLLDQALAALPTPIDDRTLDELAVDYANIYLTHGYRASPTESVWLDEESLIHQEPMFAVRRWYHHYGLAAENWRQRPDDHLILQLQFLAHLLELEDRPHALLDAARFMDQHLLCWIGDFAGRVAERCHTPYYAGLALTTAAHLEALRDLLTEITGEERTVPAEQAAGHGRAQAAEAPAAYVPGSGPSW
jgi:TorA maturation chaperone TorD